MQVESNAPQIECTTYTQSAYTLETKVESVGIHGIALKMHTVGFVTKLCQDHVSISPAFHRYFTSTPCLLIPATN